MILYQTLMTGRLELIIVALIEGNKIEGKEDNPVCDMVTRG